MPLQRWLGWRWAVLAIGRPADDVSIVKLPEDLPVSVRPTPTAQWRSRSGTTTMVAALLADLRTLMG